MSEKKGHILIVDDSPDDIQFLIENLKDSYAIMPATSGEKALQIAAKEPHPDVILMDVEMPEMNGYETCRRLKDNPLTQDISVIFVSAHDTTEEKMAGYEAGGSDYVIKPLNPEELTQKLEIAIRDKNTRSELAAEKDNIMSGFMEVLTSSGEQGVVIEFLRASFTADNAGKLATLIIDAVSKYSLNATIQLRAHSGIVNASSGGLVPPLEQELLIRLKDQGRILEKGARLILNYGNASLLVKNTPDDEVMRGRLRDHLALLAEGAGSRLNAISAIERENERKEGLIRQISDSLLELQDIQDEQRRHQNESIRMIDEMLQNLEQSFMTWGLTEEQEQNLIQIVEAGLNKSLDHYEKSTKTENRFEEVIREFAAFV